MLLVITRILYKKGHRLLRTEIKKRENGFIEMKCFVTYTYQSEFENDYHSQIRHIHCSSL